ncbi:MAG: DnaJ domain-containing protein, partial [Cyanobacteria bacterium RUI128]|nr:DnaJ domain-containing protein [Cyanobacteria bacterium RUI128]
MAKARQTLGLDNGEELTPENVKKAYRRLSLQYHPDRNPGNADAQAMFQAVNEANSIMQKYFAWQNISASVKAPAAEQTTPASASPAKPAKTPALTGTPVDVPRPQGTPVSAPEVTSGKKPYVAPEVKEVRTVLQEELLASDISDSDIPHQYRSLWQSCKTKAKYILESLKGDMAEVSASISVKLSELINDFEIISKNVQGQISPKLEKIHKAFEGLTVKNEPETPANESISLTYEEAVRDFGQKLQTSKNIFDLTKYMQVIKEQVPKNMKIHNDSLTYYDRENSVNYVIDYDAQGKIIRYSVCDYERDTEYYIFDEKTGTSVKVDYDKYCKTWLKNRATEITNYLLDNPDLLPAQTRQLLLEDKYHFYT